MTWLELWAKLKVIEIMVGLGLVALLAVIYLVVVLWEHWLAHRWWRKRTKGADKKHG